MLIKVENILTRALPKTGQLTSYQSGDDGNYQAGWWRGCSNSNNRTRFISRTISGVDVVIDRATGLMWPKDGNSAGGNSGTKLTWSNAVTYCEGLSFAGFSDWRLPNLMEMFSIMNFENTDPALPAGVFTNIGTGKYRIFQTSTTVKYITTYNFAVDFKYHEISQGYKTTERLLLAVRSL